MGSNEKQLMLGISAALALAFGVIWVVPRLADPIETAVPEEVAAVSQQVATPDPTVGVTQDVAEPVVEPEPEPEPVAEPEPVSEPETLPEVVEETAEPEPAAAPEPVVVAPAFDTFQLDKDGEALIAGRAEPDQDIAFLLGGEEIAKAKADRTGAFVAFVTIAPSDTPRVLRMVADPAGAAVPSDEQIIVSPFRAPEPEVVVAEAETEVDVPDVTAEDVTVVEDVVPEAETPAEPAREVAETDGVETPQVAEEAIAVVDPIDPEPAVEATAEPEVTETEVATAPAVAPVAEDVVAPIVADVAEGVAEDVANNVVADVVEDVVTATAPAVEAPEAPAPPPVLVADAEGVRVLQPSDVAPDVLSNVALDAITYDPSGDVLLSGRASGEGFVQVYIDNKPVTTSRISADGNWRTDLPEVDTGVYTLRIDEVDAAGDVVSRVETPFKREEPEAVAAVMAEETAEENFEVAVRTVQPGSTLWAIAREQFGEGIMYVEVFEANRDLIRDPNLIFPGQVFRMPEMTGGGGQ